jgi:hypothetical protein
MRARTAAILFVTVFAGIEVNNAVLFSIAACVLTDIAEKRVGGCAARLPFKSK